MFIQRLVLNVIAAFFVKAKNWKGFPGGSVVKNPPAMQETRFSPWVGKIPWGGEWQTTLGFLPGESHGQRSLAGDSSWRWRGHN